LELLTVELELLTVELELLTVERSPARKGRRVGASVQEGQGREAYLETDQLPCLHKSIAHFGF